MFPEKDEYKRTPDVDPGLRTHWVNTSDRGPESDRSRRIEDVLEGRIAPEAVHEVKAENSPETGERAVLRNADALLDAAEEYSRVLAAKTVGFKRILDLIEKGSIVPAGELDRTFDQKLELYEAKDILDELAAEYAGIKAKNEAYLAKTTAEMADLLAVINPGDVENDLPETFFKLKTQIEAYGNFETFDHTRRKLEAFLRSREREVPAKKETSAIRFSLVEAEEQVNGDESSRLLAELEASMEKRLRPIEFNLDVPTFLAESSEYQKLSQTAITEEGVKRILAGLKNDENNGDQIKFALSELEILDRRRLILANDVLKAYQLAAEQKALRQVSEEFDTPVRVTEPSIPETAEPKVRVMIKPNVSGNMEKLKILENNAARIPKRKSWTWRLIRKFDQFLESKGL